MAKAKRAYASARVLLGLGDVDGAVNRAYYAMFDAARAALWRLVHPSSRMWVVLTVD
ncbi:MULTISPECIES: HEPN domain-containing protein [Burkholderiaceae]|uniref:HEPN domain-containing protein n=1 Tax=Burkholderiaceae TaxID=119060 RepID=UPI001F442375|nr:MULTISPECIES: HEPN domain-containing protein [Burkholderiaceae]